MKSASLWSGNTESDNSEQTWDIYLCGPLSSVGSLDDNLALFQDWAKKLRDLGWTVFSPPEGEEPGHTWESYMRRDIPFLLRCSQVAVLPQWQESAGASLEVGIADALGVPIVPVQEVTAKMALKTEDVAEVAFEGPFVVDVVDAAKNPVKKESVLEEATRLVTRDRGNQYGPPEQDFNRTAGMWNALFVDKLKDGVTFEPKDVALAMICLKASRAMWMHKRDNYVDIAGYAGCGHRCEEGEW